MILNGALPGNFFKACTLPLPLQHLILQRTGPLDATVGMISLPLPRDLAGRVQIDHPQAAMRPVAWWDRHRIPRRVLTMVVGEGGLPEGLRLRELVQFNDNSSPGWTVETRVTREKL